MRSPAWWIVPLAFLALSSHAIADESLTLPNGGLGMPLFVRILVRNQECEAGPAPNSWLCNPYAAHGASRPAWFEAGLDAATRACLVWYDLTTGAYVCRSVGWIGRVQSLAWIARFPSAPKTFTDCFQFGAFHFSPGIAF